jgi:Flp pilus assembly protein TadG
LNELPVKKEFNQSLLSLHKNRKGQALIEFAITLPILILLVFGALDIGRLVYSNIVITNAARAGAEYLANNPKNIGMLSSIVLNDAQNSGVSTVDMAISSPDCCKIYKPVTVIVQACVTNLFLFDFINSLPSCGSGGIQISKSVNMMVLP